jgi:putative ABC transport system ATP-binding protein
VCKNGGNMAYIEVFNLSKEYIIGQNKIEALSDVSFSILQKEFVVILGPSGAGKSTLLNILGGMEKATSGKYIVNGLDVTKMSLKGLTNFRRFNVGFIFQFYNLMPNLTALENVMLSSHNSNDIKQSEEALISVGLKERFNNFPSHLSGGEQQRVSIARALVKKPMLILADEPTGALDSKIGAHIIKLLREKADLGNTVIVVTHNQEIAKCADRVIRIQDGKIISNEINNLPIDPMDIKW